MTGPGGPNDLRWAIESEGIKLQQFTIGFTPPGFQETHPLNQPIMPGTHYLLSVHAVQLADPLVLEFELGALRADSWLLKHNKRLSEATLNSDPC